MMRTLSVLSAAACGAAFLLAQAAYAQQPVQTDVPMICYPSTALNAEMARMGFPKRLTGAFQDGDLLLVYQDGKGNFHAGFAIPEKGYTCMLGGGSGIEENEIKLPDQAS